MVNEKMTKLIHNCVLALLLVIFTSHNSYSQTDSLKFGVKFWNISDSLLEVNDYEGALHHLQTGYYYQVGDNHYKAFYNKFKKKERHLDSLIICCLTDSMRCNSRIQNGIKSFKEADYSQVDRWFREARMYCKNSDFYQENLNEMSHLMPIDTVKLNYLNHGALQLMRMIGVNINIETSSPDLSSNETIYFRKDSTLYNGVVTWKQFIGSPEQSRAYKIWNIEDGKIVKYNKYSVCKNKGTEVGVTYDSIERRVLNEFDGDNYLCGIEKNMCNLKIRFSPEGDTLLKTTVDGEEMEMIRFFPDGDTAMLESTIRTDTDETVTERMDWSKDKILVFKSISKYSNNQTMLSEESINFDENGDTLTYWLYVKDAQEGVQINSIASLEGGGNYLLKTLYKNDSLVDIINSDIMFLNKRFKQIDAREFLDLLRKKQDRNFPQLYSHIYTWDSPFVIDGKEYNAVGYPRDKWDGDNGRRLRKELLKLEGKK